MVPIVNKFVFKSMPTIIMPQHVIAPLATNLTGMDEHVRLEVNNTLFTVRIHY
jgi:hypothetical protein